MARPIRASAATALLAVVALVAGCNFSGLSLMIPDFESSEVLGVRVYQQVGDTGDPSQDLVLASEITFAEPELTETGRERMEYTVEGPDGAARYFTVLRRDDQDPDRVQVDLLFQYESLEGAFRVSTYNAAGESELSEGALFL